jgi:DNA primase
MAGPRGAKDLTAPEKDGTLCVDVDKVVGSSVSTALFVYGLGGNWAQNAVIRRSRTRGLPGQGHKGLQGSLHTYSKEVVDHVLAASDIVDLVGGYVELKHAGGGRFKGLCPFHTEKTPSFHVQRERQSFYCFGCEKGGDGITFLRDHLGLSFSEALQKLAERAGIVLPAPDGGADQSRRQQLLELSRFALTFFRETLADAQRGAPGREYLARRALRPEVMEQFRVGFAHDDWNGLADAARKAGFGADVLLESGLVRRNQRGNAYGFFRNRVMFPIRDISGNPVAFGGRAIDDQPAKYVNSPESSLYKKGRTLYGLYEARESIRSEQRLILVEGYFDLLRCVDAGVANVVATCGTALTPEQAALMRRYAPEVVVVYDGDDAGVRAALRSVSLLVHAGLQVRALVLPGGQDPDDFVQSEGAEAFRRLVAEAPDFFRFYVRMNSRKMTTIEGRTEICREIFGLLAEMDDPIRQEQYVDRLAAETGLQRWTLWSEFQKFLQQRLHDVNRERLAPLGEQPVSRPAVSRDDVMFVAALLAEPALKARALAEVQQLLLPEGPLQDVLTALREGGEHVVRRLTREDGCALYAAAAAVDPDPSVDSTILVEKRLAGLKRRCLELEAQVVQHEIQQAQQQKDHSRVGALLTRKVEIDRQIQKVGAA